MIGYLSYSINPGGGEASSGWRLAFLPGSLSFDIDLAHSHQLRMFCRSVCPLGPKSLSLRLLFHLPPETYSLPALFHYIGRDTLPQLFDSLVNWHKVTFIQRFFLVHTRIGVSDRLIPLPFHLYSLLQCQTGFEFRWILIRRAFLACLRRQRCFQVRREGFGDVPEEDILRRAAHGGKLGPDRFGHERCIYGAGVGGVMGFRLSGVDR
jgi:hypothetical protein